MTKINYSVDMTSSQYSQEKDGLARIQMPQSANVEFILTIQCSDLGISHSAQQNTDEVVDIVRNIPIWAKDVTIKMGYYELDSPFTTRCSPVTMRYEALSALAEQIKQKEFNHLKIEGLNLWSFFQTHEMVLFNLDDGYKDKICDAVEKYVTSLPSSETIFLNNATIPLLLKKNDFEKIFSANPKATCINLSKTVYIDATGVPIDVTLAGMEKIELDPFIDSTEYEILRAEICDLQVMAQETCDITNRNPIIKFNSDCFKAIPPRIKTIDFSDNNLHYMKLDMLRNLAGLLPDVETIIVSVSEITAMDQTQREALIEIAPQAQFVTNTGNFNPILDEMNQQIRERNIKDTKDNVKALTGKRIRASEEMVSMPEEVALSVMSFLKTKKTIRDIIDKKIDNEKESPTP